jgi:hypothetical protein
MDKVASTLEQILAPLAVGNEGKVSVQITQTGPLSLHFKATIRQRQNPGSPFPPLYDSTESAEGDLDATNPQSIKDAKVCVPLPAVLGGGNACVTIEEIATILEAL